MEIEAKFLLPEEETLERLAAVPRLAGFELGPPRTLVHRDTYLDTADRRLLAAGWVCRVRRREGEPAVATLKARALGEVGILRREERNLVLEMESLEPGRWPSGPVRETVLALACGRQLIPLACLWQRRTLRWVLPSSQAPPADGGKAGAGERTNPTERPAPLAILSLDMVDVESPRGGPPSRSWLEAEVDLVGGREEVLVRLGRALTEEWGLVPEARSKVEHALW